MPEGRDAAKEAPNYAAMFAQLAKTVGPDAARDSGLKLLTWLGKLPSSGERSIALQITTSSLQEALGQEKYQEALRSDIMAKQAADSAGEAGEITPPEEESVSVLRAMDKRASLFASGVNVLLQRVKPEEVELLATQKRREPFWHVICATRQVYDRTCNFSVPVTGPEVQSVTLNEIDYPVINRAFAKAVFGDRNPLGQHLVLWEDHWAARDMTIVGVCGNARYGSLTGQFRPVVFMAYDQGYPRPDQMVYALRTSASPLSYVGAVRETVRRADPRIPISGLRTQGEDIDRTISQEITFARLCSAFAVLALAIACVGLYGAI